MPREVPTLNLEQLSIWASSSSPAYDYCHAWGLFKMEMQARGSTSWIIYDEIKEAQVKLGGNLQQYPKPKTGDVIRLHRLTINKNLKAPEVPLAKNVVIWPAFMHDPKPISVARSPTIKDQDITRRRILETYFTSSIDRLSEIKSHPKPVPFYNIVGRIEHIQLDAYGHLEIGFTDGTDDQMVIRVFSKKTEFETDVHFETASRLNLDDYFAASNVKLDTNQKFNVSANLMHGRAFRQVEKASILGVILSDILKVRDETHQKADNNIVENGSLSQPSENGNCVTGRRRSPRLNQNNPLETNTTSINDNLNLPPFQPDLNRSSPVLLSPPKGQRKPFYDQSEPPPKYTQFSEFVRKDGYDYHDIVGQVRAEPHPTAQYGNYIIQIYDGSQHNFNTFYGYETNVVVEGCLIMLVYSKQRETDTNDHVEMAKKLREGDLIHVRNVKVSFKDGKVKMELSANKSHNKSINMIDKDTAFGRRFLDHVETPPVEELMEMIGSDEYSQE